MLNNLTGNQPVGNQPTDNQPTDNQSPNHQPPANDHRDDRLLAIPDLVYPHIRWQDNDYARLEGRLDLYTDFVVLSKFLADAGAEEYPASDLIETNLTLGRLIDDKL